MINLFTTIILILQRNIFLFCFCVRCRPCAAYWFVCITQPFYVQIIWWACVDLPFWQGRWCQVGHITSDLLTILRLGHSSHFINWSVFESLVWVEACITKCKLCVFFKGQSNTFKSRNTVKSYALSKDKMFTKTCCGKLYSLIPGSFCCQF